jgi:ketosteroid isomerase-like protein
MREPAPGNHQLARLLDRLDEAIRQDDFSTLSECVTEDAYLLWPGVEDIVGREAIREAFVSLAMQTLSWEPEYRVVDVHGDRAYILGRFIERRRYPETGGVERVPGRIVYFGRRQPSGEWLISHVLTSRFGEETIEAADG